MLYLFIDRTFLWPARVGIEGEFGIVVSSVNQQDFPLIAPGQAEQSSQIILIDSDKQRLRPLHEALKLRGYPVRLFYNTDEALAHLSKTDILLLDAAVMTRFKAGEFAKAAKVLVLAEKKAVKLPPELTLDHVFLLHYPKNTQELIDHLIDDMAPPPLDSAAKTVNIQHLALLFNITQSLSGHLEVNALFECILALAPDLKADFAALLVQEGEETIYYRSTQPGREELIGLTGRRFAQRLLKDGIEGWVLRHNQAVVIANTMNDSRWFPGLLFAGCGALWPMVVLPFTLERVGARGVYLVGHKQPNSFTGDDLTLLEAVIIKLAWPENAMLFKSIGAFYQLSLINEVSRAATSILNLDVMLRTVGAGYSAQLWFYNVSIHLYNAATHQVELRARDTLDRSA